MSPRARKTAAPADPTAAATTKAPRSRRAASAQPDAEAVAAADEVLQKAGKKGLGLLRTEVGELATAVSSSNDSWATLAADLTSRVVAAEAALVAQERQEEGRQIRDRVATAKLNELEGNHNTTTTQLAAINAKMAQTPSRLTAVQADVADIARRLQLTESELTRHRAFHSAHGPEALTEAARAEVAKVWQVILWGYMALAGIGAWALIRTM